MLERMHSGWPSSQTRLMLWCIVCLAVVAIVSVLTTTLDHAASRTAAAAVRVSGNGAVESTVNQPDPGNRTAVPVVGSPDSPPSPTSKSSAPDPNSSELRTASESEILPTLGERIEVMYERYQLALRSRTGRDHHLAALGLLSTCIAAELERQGRSEAVDPQDHGQLSPDYPGELKFALDGRVYGFDSSEYPEYASIRSQLAESLKLRRRGQDAESRLSDELLEPHVKALIDDRVASSLATLGPDARGN